MNEELGRHRGREGKSECVLCGAECESVLHVLWECSAESYLWRSYAWTLLVRQNPIIDLSLNIFYMFTCKIPVNNDQ